MRDRLIQQAFKQVLEPICEEKFCGTDQFDNLIIIHKDVHRLIHATKDKTIGRYLSLLQLNREQLKKVNEYRKICNLTEVVNN